MKDTLRGLILSFLFTAFFLSYAFAASPVIFFSDLTSGPNIGGQDNKGAFITIWGRNFGSEQGSSYITVGGSKVNSYPVWTDTKISFQLGPNTKTGDIVVITPEGSSNGVLFTVRNGRIFFVKTVGSDTSGDGSWNNPWRTIVKAKNSLKVGDIAYICDGVSQTTLESYNACVNLGSSGTQDNPKALVAYPGATVNVGSVSIQRGFWYWQSGSGYTKWWVVSQINITASDKAIPSGYGFRIIGNRITVPNGDSASASIHGEGSHARILGNELYNCGAPSASKLYHNIYITNHYGREVSDIEIAWNIIKDSTANRGIQIYTDGKGAAPISDVRIHDNLIFNLRGNAININNHCTGEIRVYNNIIYNCGQGPDFKDGISNYAGILIGGSNNATIYLYNNNIYDCGYSLHPNNSGLLSINPSYKGTLFVRNNIFCSNNKKRQHYHVGSEPNTESSHNLFYGKGRAPKWDAAAIIKDPQFVNLAIYDFHLKPNSPAIDAGINEVNTIVAEDFDGVTRPQNKGFDIGAYEYAL